MILIAVDSRTIRSQIAHLCERESLPAISVGSVQQACAAMEAHSIRAVVLDEWFRDGTATDLIRAIRHIQGEHVAILSLAVQVRTLEDSALQPDAHVPKAMLVRDLIHEIRTQLHKKEALRKAADVPPSRSQAEVTRILVIDDSLTYREQLRASLQQAGYSVQTAKTGEDGVRMALEHPPAAMLVDSMLPGINGAEVIRRVRAESATRRMPCCLLTASEDPSQELQALDAGADSFIRKDEDMAIILARLAGILRSASTPAASSLASLPQLPRRVVLIGPTPGPLDGVGAVLLEEGCETVTLGQSQVSVDRCAALEPDILVYATRVDEKALTFCRDFKNLPALRNSRLLLLDLGDEHKFAVEALQAGADDYLPLLSDPHIILARARSQLRRKRMEDENRGLREHMLRQELETEAQRTLAETRSRHTDEMRVAYSLAERKAHEAERARLELEQITEGIPQIVWTSAADGSEPRFNRRWTDYTGLQNQGMTNSVWRRTIHRDDLPCALREWVTSFRGGLPFSCECRLRSASGEFRWFLVRAIPLNDANGNIDRWFGTCTDVHDQKLSEEALRRTEKLAATGRLAASIAHEINNPLESVTNLLYLIEQNTRTDPDTHEFVTTAQKELDRVAHISKKTLAFYRESNNAAPVDLGALVEEVAEIYSVRLERKNIRLQLELNCERQPQGLAGELRQVISNLVTNAIDASPMNAVIRVRVRESRAWDVSKAEGVRVSVGDHGHGIPANLMPEIFKPFITTKGQMGTGLGLWLSHSIIDRHGGRLTLRSSAGKNHGTCFSFFLPAKLLTKPSEADSMGSMLRTIGKELLGQ
jgi:PAS domain S-box-containing protein